MSALLVILVPLTAEGATVLCYGDSITAASAYTSKLAALKPSHTFINEGLGSDVSENAARFDAALAAHQPNIVVILIGTNDPVCYAASPVPATSCQWQIASPRRTAINVLRMARRAIATGADVIALTNLPTLCITGAPCESDAAMAARFLVRQDFTQRMAEEMFKWHRRAHLTIGNLRDQFTTNSWAALTVEGLHPTDAGYDVIAAYVASLLP